MIDTDFDLLYEQKESLVTLITIWKFPPEHLLWGLVHYLDAVLDDAADTGLWKEPQEDELEDEFDECLGCDTTKCYPNCPSVSHLVRRAGEK